MVGGGHTIEFGRFGERCAGSWYRQAGYRVEATNWRCPEGELDLVVSRGQVVVFVEVKARTSARFGTGAEAVDWRKQRKVRLVATRFLAQCGRGFQELRFDVADVDAKGHLQIHEGCF